MSKKVTLKQYINRHYDINSICEAFYDNCRDGESIFNDLWIELNDNIINDIRTFQDVPYSYLKFYLYDSNINCNLILHLYNNGLTIEYLNSDNIIESYEYEYK